MIISNYLSEIQEKLNKEHPKFGAIKIKFVFHDGRIVRYDFCKLEKKFLKENKKNEK